MKSYKVDLYTFDELSEIAKSVTISNEKALWASTGNNEIDVVLLLQLPRYLFTETGQLVDSSLATEITDTREQIARCKGCGVQIYKDTLCAFCANWYSLKNRK